MMCEHEEDNVYDECVVSVWKENCQMIGHVLIEFLKIFCNLLKDYGEIEAECFGSRYNAGAGKSLELPVDYRLIGTYNYLIRVKKKIEADFSMSIKCTAVELSSIFPYILYFEKLLYMALFLEKIDLYMNNL